MKAPIESTLTLEEVTEHFEQWRTRKKNGERIPEQLWNEAVSLVDIYGVSQVSRTLRLGGSDLNKRRGIVEASQRRQGPSGETAFVEIDPAVVDQAMRPGGTPVLMELERPDGLRLRMQPANSTDMLALMARFMEV